MASMWHPHPNPASSNMSNNMSNISNKQQIRRSSVNNKEVKKAVVHLDSNINSRSNAKITDTKPISKTIPTVNPKLKQVTITKPNPKQAGEITYNYANPNDPTRLSRGPIGLPMDRTPALLGAAKAHIQCDANVDDLAYWNAPRGTRDLALDPPFLNFHKSKQYMTFEPDTGGWNNVRMSMEIIFVFAAATGRTLVLPPDQPLYLLKADSKKKQRGFGDFFALDDLNLSATVEVITTEEFLRRESGKDGMFYVEDKDVMEKVHKVKEHCERRAKSSISCEFLWEYYRSLDNALVAPISADSHCIVFDDDEDGDGSVGKGVGGGTKEDLIQEFCSYRSRFYYTGKYRDVDLLHFATQHRETRLMEHFYNLVYFTNPVLDNYYKRFVRDALRYKDEIFCAAGKVIKALRRDAGGDGHYSSFHIRRGDLQYKRVHISAEEWVNNTQSIFEKDETLYIATDERNKTFFDPFYKKSATQKIRFLDDYFEEAGLADIDPNYFGMLDTIIASQGRAFVGTYYSTFSGYINRMRGYNGLSMKDSYYGFLPKFSTMHYWSKSLWANEYPAGWVGIDGDERGNDQTFAF